MRFLGAAVDGRGKEFDPNRVHFGVEAANVRLGIVSDTHGHVHFTLEATRMLTELAVDEVIHCGDIGSEAIVELFAPWPTHFVFGNVDDEPDRLRAAIQRHGLTCHERFGHIERCGARIAFLHSDDPQCFHEACVSGRWDIVCFGHTHVPEQRWEGSTLLVNPGALYRAAVHSLAILELPSRQVTHVEL